MQCTQLLRVFVSSKGALLHRFLQDITSKLEEQGDERLQQIKENEMYACVQVVFEQAMLS